jgi:HEAT repeat protein
MPRQLTMAEIRRELAARGIRSERAMYAQLPGAPKQLRLWGIRALEDRGSPSAIPLLGDFLYDSDENVRMAGAAALASIGGRATRHMLAGVLEIESRPAVRRAAVHALAFMFDEETLDLLLSVLRDSDEVPAARGLAAEGIANLLEHADPRKARHKQAVKVLIDELQDLSPQVRFWASFALGRLGAQEAVPYLQRLADTDEAVCHGWWSVAKEAGDAISSIIAAEPS